MRGKSEVRGPRSELELRTEACFGAILLAALLVTGCARFEPKPLSPARSADQLESRSLTNSPLETFLKENLRRELPKWPAESWDLDMLSVAAFYYQPSLEVARAQWAVARGGETTAGQRPNPTLTVTPTYNFTTLSPSPWLPLGFLDIPIETAGKRGYRRARAAHLSEAARLNIAAVAWRVRSNLRTALLDLHAAEQREALLQQQIALQQQIVQSLEQRVQAGAIASSEVVPFQINLARTRLDLAGTQRLRAEARGRVAEALAVPNRALEGIRFSFAWVTNAVNSAAELTSPEGRRTALQSRSDVLGALAEYAAAQSALQLEIAKQYPDVHLQPGYEFDQGDSKWSLGLVAELPVLNQNQGPIAEAKARREEAAARFRALQAKVLAEIDRSLAVLRATEKSFASLRSLAEAQAERRDSVAAQWKAGAVERLDLLNAQLESATAELVQLDEQIKLQQAVSALEDAVQRPLDLPAGAFLSGQRDTH